MRAVLMAAGGDKTLGEAGTAFAIVGGVVTLLCVAQTLLTPWPWRGRRG